MAQKDRPLPDVEYEQDLLTLVGGVVDALEEYDLEESSHTLRFPKGHEFAGYDVVISVRPRQLPKKAELPQERRVPQDSSLQ